MYCFRYGKVGKLRIFQNSKAAVALFHKKSGAYNASQALNKIELFSKTIDVLMTKEIADLFEVNQSVIKNRFALTLTKLKNKASKEYVKSVFSDIQSLDDSDIIIRDVVLEQRKNNQENIVLENEEADIYFDDFSKAENCFSQMYKSLKLERKGRSLEWMFYHNLSPTKYTNPNVLYAEVRVSNIPQNSYSAVSKLFRNYDAIEFQKIDDGSCLVKIDNYFGANKAVMDLNKFCLDESILELEIIKSSIVLKNLANYANINMLHQMFRVCGPIYDIRFNKDNITPVYIDFYSEISCRHAIDMYTDFQFSDGTLLKIELETR